MNFRLNNNIFKLGRENSCDKEVIVIRHSDLTEFLFF